MQAALERVGADQSQSEGVDRQHAQAVDRGEQRASAPGALLGVGGEGRGLEPVGQRRAGREVGELALVAVGHLGGGGVGEGDRHHALEHASRENLAGRIALRREFLPAAANRPGEQSRDERGRLAGSGAGFEDDRAGELDLGQAAGPTVGLEQPLAHGSPSRSGSARRKSSTSARSPASSPSRPSRRRSSAQYLSRRRAPESSWRHASSSRQ